MNKTKHAFGLIATKEEEFFGSNISSLSIEERVMAIAKWLLLNDRLDDETRFFVHGFVFEDKVAIPTTGDYGTNKEEWFKSRAGFFERIGPYTEIIAANEAWTSDSEGIPSLNADREEIITVFGLSKTHTYYVKIPVCEHKNPFYVPEVIVKERNEKECRLCLLLSSQIRDERQANEDGFIAAVSSATGFNAEQIAYVLILLHIEKQGVPREKLLLDLHSRRKEKKYGIKRKHMSNAMDAIKEAVLLNRDIWFNKS